MVNPKLIQGSSPGPDERDWQSRILACVVLYFSGTGNQCSVVFSIQIFRSWVWSLLLVFRYITGAVWPGCIASSYDIHICTPSNLQYRPQPTQQSEMLSS